MTGKVGRSERVLRLMLGILILGLYGALPAPWRYLTLVQFTALRHCVDRLLPVPRGDVSEGRIRQPSTLEPLRIRTVLVPLDGSSFAEQALPWAIASRRSHGRDCALPWSISCRPLRLSTRRRYACTPRWSSSSGSLSATTSTAPQPASRAMTRFRLPRRCSKGPPAPSLAKYVTEVGVDLVVMTTHGRGGLERAWVGSVADQLVRTLEIPMLLIRPAEGGTSMTGAKRLLVPLDGSRRAEAILPAAMALAAVTGTEIALLQAVAPVSVMTDPPTSYPMGIDEEITKLERQQAQDYLDSLAEQLTAAGTRSSGAAVLGGTAFDTIRAVADEPGTGVIAITTHGRGGVRRMVLGSIADKLVRSGNVPVLVTRPRSR